jgi:REP element-mobilizing transposase RayT
MARKLRLEFPGAVYHVINRGNYRSDIFAHEKTKEAFEQCLFEACHKSAWLLHGFIVMRNHFHLGLSTPEGNLIAGMHWLETTFATRFNRFRRENGHLFQGRYKAILVERGERLGAVCDYIHLNPVRARFLTVPQLMQYRHSSYWYLRNPKLRPYFLRPQTALTAVGLQDTPKGWKQYDRHLELQAASKPAGSNASPVNLSQGWAVGSDDFKADLVAFGAPADLARSWGKNEAAAIRSISWQSTLDRALKALKRDLEQAATARKSAPWKLAIAAWMKLHTQATNCWLCQKLSLGAPTALSRSLARYRLRLQPTDPEWKRLLSRAST